MEPIIKLAAAEKYSISKHAFVESFKDGFSVKDILTATKTGEMIEDYQDRNRCLIYGKVGGRSIHVVVDYSNRNWIWIVTVYKPDPNEWIKGRVRRSN